MIYVVATRTDARAWENRGTTRDEPTAEHARKLVLNGHVPRMPEAFSEAGMEVRFLPIGGGEPVVFRARYELRVERVTVAEADAAVLPDLDDRESWGE